MLRKIAATCCLLATATTAAAQSETRPCISPAENEALVAYVMPELVGTLGSRCVKVLPANAFLVGARSDALQQRLKPQADKAWPRAKNITVRFLGVGVPVNGPFEGVAKAAMARSAAGLIAQSFDAEQCRIADRLLTELAPLPPENLARVMALFIEVGSKSNDRVPFRVCAAD